MDTVTETKNSKWMRYATNTMTAVVVIGLIAVGGTATYYGKNKIDGWINEKVAAEMTGKIPVEEFDTIKTTVWYSNDMSDTSPIVKTVLVTESVCQNDQQTSTNARTQLSGAISTVTISCNKVVDLINTFRGK